jgi:hypothetical protein
MPRLIGASFLMFSVFLTISCGGGTPTLRSLQINQQSLSAGPEFTATATYSDGKQVTPASVSWVVWNTASFSTGQPHYQLTSSAYPPLCGAQCTGWTVVAIAPADPKASMSGPIPMTVFQDLISGKASSEGGFVAATMQL